MSWVIVCCEVLLSGEGSVSSAAVRDRGMGDITLPAAGGM